jgi:hypothetical protein
MFHFSKGVFMIIFPIPIKFLSFITNLLLVESVCRQASINKSSYHGSFYSIKHCFITLIIDKKAPTRGETAFFSSAFLLSPRPSGLKKISIPETKKSVKKKAAKKVKKAAKRGKNHGQSRIAQILKRKIICVHPRLSVKSAVSCD